MTFKILASFFLSSGHFFVIVSSLNYYLYFMVGASGCAEEPDIRDEFRFFWTVSAWESEFVVGDSCCLSFNRVFKFPISSDMESNLVCNSFISASFF